VKVAADGTVAVSYSALRRNDPAVALWTRSLAGALPSDRQSGMHDLGSVW